MLKQELCCLREPPTDATSPSAVHVSETLAIRRGLLPAPPNSTLRDPIYHLIETIRPLVEVHRGGGEVGTTISTTTASNEEGVLSFQALHDVTAQPQSLKLRRPGS